jgi:tripartite-type tricarboxylate transporter receptor subunit TctC
MTTETLHFESARAAQQVFGGDDRNLRSLEQELGVKATVRDGMIRLDGEADAVGHAKRLFTVLADHIKAGKVRALGVTSAEPSAALLGVPAIARGDPGLRGYEVANWLGLVAPAATPRSVVNTIHAAVVASAADTAVRTQLLALGIEPLSSTPEAFAALMREEIDKWARIVRASGARVD